MITIDNNKHEVRVSDDTSLQELAEFLNENVFTEEYKVTIYEDGTEQGDVEGLQQTV